MRKFILLKMDIITIKKICRTSDEEKKYNFTDEEATGYEVGVYDIDTNKLYYYWTSF